MEQADMVEEDFYAAVMRRTGIATLAESRLAALAVVDAMRELLSAEEARSVALCLPAELTAVLERPTDRPPEGDIEALVHGVEWRENVRHEFALEHTLAVCEAIATLLPPDLTLRLAADLPAQLARVLRARTTGRPQAHRRERPSSPPRETLATGKPGSARPLSEARPRTSQQDSVAEQNPHGETKLSSAHGLTQERLRDTLAEGAPPQPKRPLSNGR